MGGQDCWMVKGLGHNSTTHKVLPMVVKSSMWQTLTTMPLGRLVKRMCVHVCMYVYVVCVNVCINVCMWV